MRLASWTLLAAVTIAAAAIVGHAQTTNPAASDRLPVVIVKYKIGVDYYPMLDRPGTLAGQMSADTGDFPQLETERLARRSRSRFSVTPEEERRARGRIRSYTRVIDDAHIVQVVLKNTESKPIKSVAWDFAFPRYENGQLLSRYDVTTEVEIKPGGKKTIKYKLPAGAKRCEVVKVTGDDKQAETVSTFEAVCGKGFHDPSLLNQKQETISIKRIEYADGSMWQRP